MEEIKNIIEEVIKNLETQKSSSSLNPQNLIKHVLTKKELKHVRVNNFRMGILSIYVDSSSWLYHLGLKKLKILSQLKKKNQKIKDIHFYLGKING